jgi:ubiquitin-like 1-activating enzyme E1 A
MLTSLYLATYNFYSDEAALYDRQIRLWGLEAQNRMRNATILVANLRGVATETIKNIVLAGIGKLILVDAESVTEEDLGAGFFFREGDVGKNVRVPLTLTRELKRVCIFL